MRAYYVECMLSKLIKNYTLLTFPPSNRRNFEDSGKVLATSVLEICQCHSSALPSYAYKMVTAIVCVLQVDSGFCNM